MTDQDENLATLFRAPNGRMFAYRRGYGSRSGDMLYSNGPKKGGTTTFYSVFVKEFVGTTSQVHRIAFRVPGLDFGGMLVRDHDTITYDDGFDEEVYTRQPERLDLTTVTVVELEPVFTIDGLCKTADGLYVLALFEAVSNRSYLFVGGRIVETERHHRHIDRGETTVVAAFDGHEVVIGPRGSTFDGVPMEKLVLEEYNVEHDLGAGTASVTKHWGNEAAED